MAEYTPFLNLYKPSRNDSIPFDTSLADNFNKLDNIIQDLSGEVFYDGETFLSYNPDGTLREIETPQGLTTFSYEDNQLKTVVESKENQTITTTLSYDSNGNLQSVRREVI